MAKRTLLLVATGIVLIGALAWGLLHATTDAPPINSANDLAPLPANAAASTSSSPPPESPGAVAARRAAADDRAAMDRSTIVVVQHADGTPAAGAEVRYWPSRGDTQLPASLRAVKQGQDLEAALTASGAVATTDDAGRVTLPTTNGPLCARLEQEYGEWRNDDATDGKVTIVLARDLSLRVEVVDDTGRPAPGRSLWTEAEFVNRDQLARDTRVMDFGPTDERGFAVLPHVQAAIPMPSANILEWSMQVYCLGLEDDAHRVDARPDALATGIPLRLVVPSGGTVELEVVDAHGTPMWASPMLQSDGSKPQSTSNCDDNRFLFFGVPVGRRCVATANPSLPHMRDKEADKRAGVLPIERIEFDGPISVADVVKARIVVPVTFWRLKAQLRLPGYETDVAPEWSTTVVAVDGATRTCDGSSTQVSDGRLQINFCTEPAQELRDLKVRAGIRGAEAWSLTVPGPIRPDNQDLGVLQALEPSQPQSLAQIVAHLAGEDVTATARVALFTRHEHRLERIPTRTARRDDGASEVFGPPTEGPITLHCRHDGALSHREDIEPGSRVEIRLEPAAALTVRLLAPGLPRGAVSVAVESLDVPDESYDGDSDSEWTFTWESLRPGRYRLLVLLHDERFLEQELPPLAIGPNVWPANGPFELRGVPRVVLAAMVGSNGRRLDSAWQTSEPDAKDVPADLAEQTNESDLATIVLTSPRDLLVAADGHTPIRLRVPPHDFRVALAPATTVLVRARETGVRVTFAYELPPTIDPRLAALDAQVADRPTEFEFVDDYDAMEVTLPPGSTIVLQKVRGEQAEPPVRVPIGSSSPQEIVVQ